MTEFVSILYTYITALMYYDMAIYRYIISSLIHMYVHMNKFKKLLIVKRE